MPLFPGERPITGDEVASPGFQHNASPQLYPQTGLHPEQVQFSIVPGGGTQNPDDGTFANGSFTYFCARPWRVILGPTQVREADPDTWFIFDDGVEPGMSVMLSNGQEDVDETEGWLPQAVFNAQGHIDYGENAEVGAVMEWAERQATTGYNVARSEFLRPDPADEGDAIGAQPPRHVGRREGSSMGGLVRSLHELLQEERPRLPQGNSSVRDAVARMRELSVSDAVYADDRSLDNMMMGRHFVTPTASAPYNPNAEVADDEPVPAGHLTGAPDAPFQDINGNPLVAKPAPKGPMSVYDHLAKNLEDVRRSRPVPSVWERLAAQRDKK